MFFKIKKGAGNHTQLNAEGIPTVYKAGNTLESDTDLVKCFPKKFERLMTSDDSPAPDLAPGIPMSSAVMRTALDSETPELPTVDGLKKDSEESLGDDITSQYKIPKGKNLKVFTKGGGWCTIRINDDSKLDEKLRMNAVQAWINLAS